MVRAVRVHGADYTEIVGAFAEVRENLADLRAALAELLELEWGLEQVAGLALRSQIGRRHRLAVILGEHRLGIEGVDLAGTAVEEQENHTLSLRGEMRRLHFERT